MRTTLRMLGIADFITIGNGLLGALALLFLILATEGLAQPTNEVNSTYLWLAILCILLSAIGDAIDGPVARRYSKRQLLGGSLDLMSDCLSFGVAPALLIFVMFSRWGVAAPLWTVGLAIACCWIMTASMLRLARFEVESTDANNWFHGLSTPMSALMLITTCGVIWLQPETIWGPGIVEWDWGSGEHPYFDFMILPVAFLCGCLMISDRKLPKGRSGLLLRLSALALLCLLSAIIIQVGWGLDADGSPSISSSNASLILLSGALLLVSSYILFGPRIVAATATTGDNEVDEVETAVGTLMDAAEVIVTSLRGEDVESEAESKEQ